MPETKSLPVDLLRIDAGTQSRVSINEEVVEDYFETIQGSKQWPFDPIDVFHDGSEYFVADGFHRTLGATRAKRSSVPCRVHKGTARDARIFGMTANDQHGLRMNRKDKRACVEWLLDNEPKMTQAEIARKAGVTERLVRYIVAERKSPPSDSSRKVSYSSKKVADSSSEKGRPGGVSRASQQTTPVSSDPVPEEAAGASGEERDSGTETTEEPQETGHRPPRSGKDKPVDYGKCPNCAATKWDVDEFGVSCAKCHHPHGEPVGDRDTKDPAGDLRAKTVKTLEAAGRCFDDLHLISPRSGTHKQSIELCKKLILTAKSWK